MYTGKTHPHPWLIHSPHTRFVMIIMVPWPTFRYAYLAIEKESFHLDDDASSLEAWQYTRNTLFLVLYNLFLGRLYKPSRTYGKYHAVVLKFLIFDAV